MALKDAITKYRQKNSAEQSDIFAIVAEQAARKYIEEHWDDIQSDIESAVQDEIKNLAKRGLKGEKGEPGTPGRTPTKAEIQGLIKPLIPNVQDGKDGETPSDTKLVRLIKPLIPEPKNGKDGKDGSPDTPDEVTNKVNKGKPLIKQERIEGLKETFDSFKTAINRASQNKGGGGGMGNPTTFSFSGDGSTTGFTLSSNVAANGLAIWAYYQGQWLQPNIHFSVSGKILTTTFTPENGSSIEGFFLRT